MINDMNAIIVEDEKHNRETLKNLLEEFCEGVNVIAMAASVSEAVEKIRANRPEVVFLDIELQAGTGFDVLNALNDLNFDVIFTTAFEQYALRAIKYSSIDYLLKPIDLEELQEAVKNARAKKDREAYHKQLELLLNNLDKPKEANNNICLYTSDGIEFIKIRDILYCEAAGSYTTFVLIGNKKIVVSKNLKEYENLLPEEIFMRVHNSFLINLHEVRKFVKSEGGHIIMNNDAMISISQKKREDFMQKMIAITD